MTLRFTVPGPPQPKQRARKGKNGHWYTPEATRAYEERVRLHGLRAVRVHDRCNASNLGVGRWPTTARYALTLRIVFADRRRRDADNVAKAIQDALNGVVWADDSQITALACTREVDAANPRVDVTIERKEP